MLRLLSGLLSLLLIVQPASAAVVQITVKDAAGTTRNMNVTTNSDITGNLDFNQVICDQAAGTTCASVGTAGSPSTNALTVQAVTLGHGTAANAMRVELPTDGTGVVGLAAGTAVIGHVIVDSGTVTTVSTVTNLAQMNGAALLMGNGVTGTGSQRVTIASDNTAFSVNLGTIGGAATAANQATEISSLATIATNTGAAVPAGTATIGNVGVIIPAGATAITASATGTTGATTATLAGTSGKTTYMCWSSVRANANAATTVTDTITGVITGTLSRSLWVAPSASGLGVDEMIYNPCVPASAQNTGIAIVSGAPGTGGVVTVNGGGYQL